MAAGKGFPEQFSIGLAVTADERAADPVAIRILDSAGDERRSMGASDFLRVDTASMGGPCRNFFRHPGVKETGALTSGGIAVEEQRARRHAATPFQFGCGMLKCRTGPLLRFPVVAVPERGGKQNQPVSISQIIEAETFQGIGPLPVATAEEYHDCLRLTCGESVCEFDSING